VHGKKNYIHTVEGHDPPTIAGAFQTIGWNKPESQYQRYRDEQVAGIRTCFVAVVDGQFAGYVTLNWRPTYEASRRIVGMPVSSDSFEAIPTMAENAGSIVSSYTDKRQSSVTGYF
jgi:hypothetical protein